MTISPSVVALVAIALARTVAAGPAASDWSKPADGVRARLVVTATTDDKHRAQIEVALEVENVSDVDGGIPLSWGYVGDMLALELVDEAGKVVVTGGLGGSHASGPPYVVNLPNDSMLHHTISKAAIEYVSADRKMFRPLTFQGWDLPAKHGKLYVRGKLSPHAPEKPNAKLGARAWTTSLELPRIALP